MIIILDSNFVVDTFHLRCESFSFDIYLCSSPLFLDWFFLKLTSSRYFEISETTYPRTKRHISDDLYLPVLILSSLS